nr:hypothetical protein BgiMline_015281 [Biomphalaria glabrata]
MLIILLLDCVVLSYTSDDIINKQFIEHKDTFEITCDISKYKASGNSRPGVFVSELKVSRMVGNDYDYKDIATLMPNIIISPVKISNIPEGRQWKIEYSGGYGSTNANTVKITIQVNDATCFDAGWYRCYFRFSTSQEVSSTLFELKWNETIDQGVIDMDSQSGHGQISVGELITLTCTANGPSYLRTVWTYTNKTSSKVQRYNNKNNIIDFSPTKAFNCNGCRTHFHMTRLKFNLGTSDDGTTFYCYVFKNDTLKSKAHFKLESIKST